MKNETQRDKLIEAICKLDIEAISGMMDGDELHFGLFKRDAADMIERKLTYLSNEYGQYICEAMPWKCEYDSKSRESYNIMIGKNQNMLISNDDLCDELHCNPVRFTISNLNFIWDITETKPGKFKLEPCNSYKATKYYMPGMLIVYKDQFPSFQPDAEYLSLMRELNNVLKPFDDGQIIFWFPEDLHEWLCRQECLIERTYKHYEYITITKKADFFSLISEIEFAYAKNKIGIQAIDYFNFVNDKFINEYGWYYEKFKDLLELSFPEFIDISKLDKGYFTLSDYYPNLRFSSRGIESILDFIEKVWKPYKLQKQLVSSIDKSWYIEDLNEFEIPY